MRPLGLVLPAAAHGRHLLLPLDSQFDDFTILRIDNFACPVMTEIKSTMEFIGADI